MRACVCEFIGMSCEWHDNINDWGQRIIQISFNYVCMNTNN